MEFPAMLYKTGTMFEWDGGLFDYVIVADADEAEIALADGWVPHKPAEDEAPARRGRPRKTEGLN